MQVREAGALPLDGAQDLSPGVPRAVTGDRLLQKSWGESSWEATCPDSCWGWLEPQEDAGGPQVGVSPQRPAAESGGGVSQGGLSEAGLGVLLAEGPLYPNNHPLHLLALPGAGGTSPEHAGWDKTSGSAFGLFTS